MGKEARKPLKQAHLFHIFRQVPSLSPLSSSQAGAPLPHLPPGPQPLPLPPLLPPTRVRPRRELSGEEEGG
eukprot:1195319-Rhodomonas_salina.1